MIITVGLVVSCDEADKAAETARQAAKTARDTIGSPAGQYLPPDWRAIGLGAAAVLEAAALAYQAARRKKDLRITKAIVRGVEAAAVAGKPEAVKGYIHDAMLGENVLVEGTKRVVDLLGS